MPTTALNYLQTSASNLLTNTIAVVTSASSEANTSSANSDPQQPSNAATIAAASTMTIAPTATTAPILQALMRAVRELQTSYAGAARKEIATDTDVKVQRLCDLWDTVLAHGLRPPPVASPAAVATALLQNVAERVTEAVTGAQSSTSNPSAGPSVTFFTFAEPLLTGHERERFHSLQHVHSDHGRGRALLRAALNERSLERYILVWLNAPHLPEAYESWAVLRDPESVNLLPSIAAGLGTILFAIRVDNSALNARLIGWGAADAEADGRNEPIIVVPAPTNRVKVARRRHLVSFGEDEEQLVGQQRSTGQEPLPLAGSPRTLSSMCLRQTGPARSREAEPPKTTTTATSAATPFSAGSNATVVVPFRPYEAVFGLQPELPSEIIEIKWNREQDDEKSADWRDEADPMVSAQFDDTYSSKPSVAVDVDDVNQPASEQFVHEVFDEHEELAQYLATEAAQRDGRQRLAAAQQAHHEATIAANNSTDEEEDGDDDKSGTVSSVRSAEDARARAEADGHEDSVRSVELMKMEMQTLRDRCAELEAKVAMLSLDNTQLRAARGQSFNFAISIIDVQLDKSTTKSHYKYTLRIVANDTPTARDLAAHEPRQWRRAQWTVTRRYSQFYHLHRKYRGKIPAVKALDFPPKKRFGNLDEAFVENRRQRLQIYIRHFYTVVPEARVCSTAQQLQTTMPFFAPGDYPPKY